MVSKDHKLSQRRQCARLQLSRSTLYYQPKGESAENLRFMEIINKQFLETPWYGSQPIGIEGAIGEQVICGEVVDQFRHSAQVVRLPRQQAEIDKVAKRVGQGKDLGRYATARTA